MLPFEFGDEARALVEAIAESDDGAREIGLRLRFVAWVVLVVDFAVAEEGRSRRVARERRERISRCDRVGQRCSGAAPSCSATSTK